ncbi:MAG: LysM peptidoglycan-binding domain-containing protein [bacterium]
MPKSVALLVATLLLATGCATQTSNFVAPGSDTNIPQASPGDNEDRDNSSSDAANFSGNNIAEKSPTAIDPAPAAAVHTDLWHQLSDNFSLPKASDQPSVRRELNWFSHNQTYIDRIASRGEHFLFYIAEEVRKRGMPSELALLPAIESAFNPHAMSRRKALGLWQFMPRTADHFNLSRDWWRDERGDVVASTTAALDYLDYLHDLFDGDWLLAIAAYNCGEGTVRRAIRKNTARGKPTDFWSLKLPRETRTYVPRLLALRDVVANPAPNGVALPLLENRPFFEIVSIPGQIDLEKAAELAGIDYSLMRMLNPAFKRNISHPDGPHRLLLPVGSADAFLQSLAAIPSEQWAPAKVYTVKRGDSLYKIARHHHLRTRDLKHYNKLRTDVLQIGQRLKIPGTHSDLNDQGTRGVYTVQAGDSLWLIARRHDISLSELIAWNHLEKTDTLRPGQTLSLAPKDVVSASASPRLESRTKEATTYDQQSSPATKSAVKEGAVKKDAVKKGAVKKVTYSVRRGDSLYRIAENFVLSVSDIVKWNDLDQKAYLRPGQPLTLFVKDTLSQ